MPALYLTPALIFAFVLARVGGLVMTAPLFSSHFVPKQLRIMLAVTLALVIAPTQWSVHVELPSNLAVFGVALGGELLIGWILGLGVAILLAGVQVAGGLISQMSGLSLAEVFSPGFDGEMPLAANLLYMVTLAIFVTIGGHRLLLSALLETYRTVPIGQAGLPTSLGVLISSLLSESFSLAIRGAAPAMVALLLGSVVLGLLSRTMPQLNILSLGMGLNALVMLAVLGVSIGSIAWLFQEQLEPALTTIVSALRQTPS
jgi:flagellar biosynthetic protein FliR